MQNLYNPRILILTSKKKRDLAELAILISTMEKDCMGDLTVNHDLIGALTWQTRKCQLLHPCLLFMSYVTLGISPHFLFSFDISLAAGKFQFPYGPHQLWKKTRGQLTFPAIFDYKSTEDSALPQNL